MRRSGALRIRWRISICVRILRQRSFYLRHDVINLHYRLRSVEEVADAEDAMRCAVWCRVVGLLKALAVGLHERQRVTGPRCAAHAAFNETRWCRAELQD